MIRIGIVGSDSFHAQAFSSIVNHADISTGQYLYPDFKITAIYGESKSRTEEMAKTYHIPVIVQDVHEMPGIVDAVMILLRDGNLHLTFAIPFLKAGIPVWIDKPFTASKGDCYRLLSAAKSYHTLITGGSTCIYMDGVKLAKQFVENASRLGQPLGGTMNYPADTMSEYGGFYFYSPHLCEMCLQIFGYDPVSVIATENNGSVSAIVKYSKYNIVLNFLKDAPEHYLMINGSKSTVIQELDSPVLPYYNGFQEFAKMLQTGVQPLSYSQLYASVSLMNAMIQSYSEKREVGIELFDELE